MKTDYFTSLSSARRYLASLDRGVYTDQFSVAMPVYSHDKPITVSATVHGREYCVTRSDDSKISQKFTGYAS